MRKNEAVKLVEQTFSKSFSEESFHNFIRNLLNGIQLPSTKTVPNAQIPQGFREHVHSYTRLGTYQDPQGYVLDVVLVKLKNTHSLDRARTRQRNLMAHYLKSREKDGVLVAYVTEDPADWRFSYVKLAYQTDITEQGKVKVKTEFSPARRFSFLVGKNEPNHTAQQQLVPLLMDEDRLTLEQIEEAFNIESVTKEFFEDYKSLFLKIKENLDQIVATNKQVKAEFERREIDTGNFAKKLLGQVVFLYFLQKKGWLGVEKDAAWGTGDKNFLFKLFEDRSDKNYFEDILEPFFYEALAIERKGDYYPALKCKVPFLNGGLFEPLNGYDWDNILIDLHDEVFAEIFKVFNLYNFTVREDEPLEREVAVDPEMLGKVFENLLEVKDRKSKGTYYTPREIVHYMCQVSLINYLDTALNGETPKITKEEFETFIREGDVSLENDLAKEAGRKGGDYGLPESIREFAKEIDFALADVKICDPAIGSGAFPVGMMTEIVRARSVLTPYLKNQRNRDAYNFKWHCIENSLYGVDIDSSAVEIAKLRLWLSLVVDEESYDHIRPLPNLDYRVICGNSLLSVQKDLFNYTLYPELERKKIQYFGATNQRNKDALRREINVLVDQLTDGKKVFDFKVYFSEVYSNNKGFDIVIGNPPYIKEYTNRNAFDGLRKSPYYQGKMDIWYFFGCIGLDILCSRGVECFIAPNNWISNYGASIFRNKIITESQIMRFIDFGDFKVFEAGIQTMVCLIRKSNELKTYEIDYRKLLEKEADHQTLVDFLYSPSSNNAFDVYPVKFSRHDFADQFITFLKPHINSVLQKIGQGSITHLDDNEVAQGIVSPQDFLNKKNAEKLGRGYKVGDGVFILSIAEKKSMSLLLIEEQEIIRPFYTTNELRRYYGMNSNKYWVIYTRSDVKTKINSYPNIKNHLDKFKNIITSDNKPYGLHRARNENIFKGEKIISLRKCLKPTFTYTDFDCYVSQTFFVIKTNRLDMKYLTGLLNSKLISYWLLHKGKMQGSHYQIDKEPLLNIPIRIPMEAIAGKISSLVDQIIERKSKSPSNDTSVIERKIDQLVYDLYGLTEEELAIVEESVGR